MSQLYMPYVNGKLSISWLEICIFEKDGRKTKKITALEALSIDGL